VEDARVCYKPCGVREEYVQMGETNVSLDKEFTIPMRFTHEFVRSLFDNYPEAGNGCAIQCVDWCYGDKDKPFKMDFIDTEESKPYRLTLDKAVRGFKRFIQLKMEGQLAGVEIQDYHDASEYDAVALDCITQCALFGEVIYG
jgi:hypothetical protein